jgi:hypothetical protein
MEMHPSYVWRNHRVMSVCLIAVICAGLVGVVASLFHSHRHADDTTVLDRPGNSAAPDSHGQDDPLEARFVAKVEWIEMIGRREATVVPIGPDPRYLIAVEIVDIHKSAKPFERNGKVVLAVHSPILLFAKPASDILGKTCSFKVSGQMRDGRPSYWLAEAKEN